MENKEHIHKIISNLKDIELCVDAYAAYSKIPQVELDLLLSKLQGLYDNALQLNRSNARLHTIVDEKKEATVIQQKPQQHAPSAVTVEHIQPKPVTDDIEITLDEAPNPPKVTLATEPLIIAEVPHESVQIIEKVKQPIQKPTFDEVHIEEFSKTVQAIVAEELHPEPESKPEITSFVEPVNEKKTVEHKSSLSDKIIATQTGSVLANKISNKPISNINSAIGLNDKFLYIRQLFHGKADDFSKTVEYLNTLTDFNSAIDYLLKTYQWDTEDATVIKFLEIVNRRYL